jgi:hypothetical protein
MRHFLFSASVKVHPPGMLEPAWPALLITMAGGLLGMTTGNFGAFRRTVTLAAITARANDDLLLAAGTGE